MSKKILFGILIFSVIVSLTITVQRISIEQSNQTVELIADFQDFANLTSSELTMDQILQQLRVLGANKIALSELTVAELLVSQPDFYLGEHYMPNVISEPLGFNQAEVDLVMNHQLEPIPKVMASEVFPFSLQEKLTGFNTNMVIFSGNKVIGYPESLAETSVTLEAQNLLIGLVEFSNQSGMNRVATGGNVVRLHAINQSEMNVLSKERIINRYLRAVRERNIRGLYLRPFAEDWQQTVALIEELVIDLNKAGFSIGSAQPYQSWQPSLLSIWLIIIGVLAALFWLTKYFLIIPEKILWCCYALTAIIGLWGLSYNQILFKQGFALLAAIVFPILAILNYNYFKNSIIKNYILISAISLAGGLLIAGLLSGTSFLVKLVEFRGVKLMHVAPVIAVFAYGLFAKYLPILSWQELKTGIKQIWQAAIPVKYLFAGFLLLAVASVYILRTGNFGLPVMEFEIKFREALERLLLVRPRSKEFLIGHPGLFLLLAANKQRAHPLLLSVAVIGQLSLVNTFTHIHTPIHLSLLRTFYGLILGFLIGWIIYRTYQMLKRRLINDPRFRILWLSK